MAVAGFGPGAGPASGRHGRRAGHPDAEQARSFLVFGVQADVELPLAREHLGEAEAQSLSLGLQVVVVAGARPAEQGRDQRRRGAAPAHPGVGRVRVAPHDFAVVGRELPVALAFPLESQFARAVDLVDGPELGGRAFFVVAAVVIRSAEARAVGAGAQSVVLIEDRAIGAVAAEYADADADGGFVGRGHLGLDRTEGGEQGQRQQREAGIEGPDK